MHKIIQGVREVFREIDLRVTEFELASGIRCRPGCGQCCHESKVEVSPVELLPIAGEIVEQGKADVWHEIAAQNPKGRCVFYAPDPFDPSLGRCTIYLDRPALCRLFGFAAVRAKSGEPKLASCHWHKKLQPEAVAKAVEAVRHGSLPAPRFTDYQDRLRDLSPSRSDSALMPINEALMRAIEKASYHSHDPESPTEIPA